MTSPETTHPFEPQLGNPWIDEAQQEMTAAWLDDQLASLRIDLEEAAGSADRAIAAVRRYNGIVSHVRTHADAANLAFRRNSNDADLAAANTELRGRLMPRINDARLWIAALCEDPVARAAISTEFGEHFIAKMTAKAKVAGAVDATVFAEAESLVGQYAGLQAAGRFTYDDAEVTYAHARKAAADPDTTIRHAAFASYVASLASDGDDMLGIYIDMLELRRRNAMDAGFESFTDYRYAQMGRTDWGPNDAAHFRAGVRTHLLPLAADIRRRQAVSQGVDVLHPADVDWFPANQVSGLRVAADDFVAAAGRMFDRMGEPFASFFADVVADGRIDAFPREGKAPGAYVATMHDGCEPFIYMNCLGLQRDVKTITHESGHAFQTTQVAPIELVDLRKPTEDACEIHSMTLELLALPAASEFFTDDDLRRYRQDLVEQAVLHICYCCAIDEFQHVVHEPSFDATPATLAETWQSIADVYLPGIDHAASSWWHSYRWMTQRHVFMFPFYYIDYAIAQTVAFELWRREQHDHASTMDTYLAICRRGGTASLRDIVRDAGLPNPFAEQSLGDTAAFIRDEMSDGIVTA